MKNTVNDPFRSLCATICAAAAGLLAAPALGHVILTSHETRDGSRFIKAGPCGRGQSERGPVVHRFESGQAVRLVWDEFVSHPGYFRISFDDEGDDDFIDPAGYYDLHTNDTVLMDGLYPHYRGASNVLYEVDLRLPDVTCERCTIQLVQVMTDKPPYVAGTNDLYYNCLDVTLVPEPSAWSALFGLLALYIWRRKH